MTWGWINVDSIELWKSDGWAINICLGPDEVYFIQTHICKPSAYVDPQLTVINTFHSVSNPLSLIFSLSSFHLSHICWSVCCHDWNVLIENRWDVMPPDASACEDVMNIGLNVKLDTFTTHQSPYWMKLPAPPGILFKLCDISTPTTSFVFFCRKKVIQVTRGWVNDAKIFIFGFNTTPSI